MTFSCLFSCSFIRRGFAENCVVGLSFAELGSPLNVHLTVRVFDVTGVWPPVEVQLCCCVQGGKSSVSDIICYLSSHP